MDQIRLSSIITPHFRSFWWHAKQKQHLRYVLKGGRGSGKSFHIALRVVQDMIEYPVSALVMRKVQTGIRKSVYQEIKSATKILGVSHLFRFIPSQLEIVYEGRGNRIYFSGADDPDKIKSIKDAEFPVAVLWIEELAEFRDEDEITTIENSILREELRGKIQSETRATAPDFDYSFYYSYNPPKRKQSWVNKRFESHFVPENTFVDHSTYLDNPYLSQRFIQEAEDMKRSRPLRYRWVYLGEPIGSGIVPFDNLVFRTITDEEVASFNNIRQGIDWGYGVDPLSFGRWHFDKKRRKLYAIDEIYGVKISNEALASEIIKRGYQNTPTIADSAEPKSVDELKLKYHIRVKGAKKGPGSVEYGEKWLDELDEIIIDANRTPNTAKEFEDIDYQTDRDGNVKNRLQDDANHSIDQVRYALEDDMLGVDAKPPAPVGVGGSYWRQ